SKNMKPFLAHQITASSFGTPSKNEVPMTSHMFNTVGLPKPDESLIPSPHKVNADESFDKSSSRTSVQSVTMPKAKTDKKKRKKQNTASS
ncbi:hypothetical protein Tco_0288979, partial [Tanacetum coccineum]